MKKNKFLKYLASILVAFSFIGSFVFGLFLMLGNKQHDFEVKADYSLGTSNGSGEMNYSTSRYQTVTIPVNYTTSTTYVTNNVSTNYLAYSVSILGGDYFKFQGTTYSDTGYLNQQPQTVIYNAVDGIYPTNCILEFNRVDLVSSFNEFTVSYNLSWYNNDTLLRTDFVSGGYYVLNDTGLTLDYFTYRISLTNFNFSLYGSDSTDSYLDGFGNGYDTGYTDGYNSGYNEGQEVGYQNGVDSLEGQIQQAYQQGYAEGFNEGFDSDSTASTIFSGILQVALVPINFFLGIFNFEILGINLRAFIQALFTVAITIIIIKAIIGAKGSGD